MLPPRRGNLREPAPGPIAARLRRFRHLDRSICPDVPLGRGGARLIRIGLACKGGRPDGRGLGGGRSLPGVGRSVLPAGRAQFGAFRRHPGLPDGRHGRAARRGSLPAQVGRAAVYLPAIRGGRARRARRRPVRCGRGAADRGERGRPAGDAVPGAAALPIRRAWSAWRRIGSGDDAGRGGGGYLAGPRQGHTRLRPGGHSPRRGGAVRPDAAGCLPAEGRDDRTGRGPQAHPGDLRGVSADHQALPGRCHGGRRVRRDGRGRVRGDPGEFGMVLGGRVRRSGTCQPGGESG